MTTAETKVTFFHLPCKARDLVYYHALGSFQRSFRYGRFGFLISPAVPEPTSPTVEGLPLWLLTSRSVCEEVVDLLLRTRRFSPNTATHRCKSPPQLTRRCIAPWHPPRLTGQQRARMKCEQRQQQLQERRMQEGYKSPKRRMARAPRGADPPKVSARLATILSCSPVSQFLLLNAGNIRHTALNLPVNVTYQSSPWYAFDMTTKNDIRPWTEFLTMIHPLLHPTDPRLTLIWDAKEPQHLEPYFEWPEEWRGRFTHVGMALLATKQTVWS